MGFFNRNKEVAVNELPYGWIYKNKDFTEKINSEYTYFLNAYINNIHAEPRKHFETLKSFVVYLNDTKKLCYSKDKYFAFWFSDIIASDEYINKLEQELIVLETNWHKLQEEYNNKQAQLIDLDKKVLNVLQANQGIMQADFIKLFDATIKHDVSSILYKLTQDGIIERTKSGRSYILNLKK